MKVKLMYFIMAAAILLLCACQSVRESQNTEDSPTPVLNQSEQVEPSPEHEIENVEQEEPEEKDRSPRFLPVPLVCELDFTETESFPFPFEDKLRIDYQHYPHRLTLSIEQALYDYDTMWQLLEENYPFLETIKRDLGIDWEEVKAEYRQIMESRTSQGYIENLSFGQTIGDCLREFQSVGHLFLITADSRNAILGLFKDDEDAPYKNIFKIANNPKSELFYKYFQFPYQYQGSGSSNSEPEKDEPVSIEGLNAITEHLLTGYAEGRVPYLKISSFSKWDDDAQTKLEDFFSSISQEEHLIIDVRGNGGGSDNAWRSGIVPFLAQQEYKFTRFWGAKSGSLNLMLEPEFDKSRGIITRYTDDSWQEEFPYISPDMLTGIDTMLKVTSTMKCADVPDKFHGKIWLLVDEYCYSATEALACFCKETGFATLVGTQTGGNGKGTQPYFMALPYSGLLVEYETYLTFNTDGTCNAIFGTVPDIVPEEGRGALETCLMAINGELEY